MIPGRGRGERPGAPVARGGGEARARAAEEQKDRQTDGDSPHEARLRSGLTRPRPATRRVIPYAMGRTGASRATGVGVAFRASNGRLVDSRRSARLDRSLIETLALLQEI